MSLTIDCGEGKHDICSGTGRHHYLIPQLNDGEEFECACSCHKKEKEKAEDGVRHDLPTLSRWAPR